MKFIFNGKIFQESETIFNIHNPAVAWGDLVYELIKVADGNILLSEEHYFNLMASMRILRMNIPMNFTQEFFEEQINLILQENKLAHAQVKISVFRDGIEDLCKSSVSYVVEVSKVFDSAVYSLNIDNTEVDIYKDYAVNNSFFSQLNQPKSEEVIAHAYRQENEYQDLILLNHEKRIARSLYGSLFLVQGNVVKTPKITEGGLRSVTRNFLCKALKRNPDYLFEETEIFPFELQKTDEVFVCLEAEGLRPIHKNRKKEYFTENVVNIVNWMNEFNS